MPAKHHRKLNPRHHRADIYLTHEELLLLREAASLSAMTLTQYVRTTLFLASETTTSRRRRTTRRNQQELVTAIDNLCVHLSRIGNNVNQLAHQANTGMVPVDKRHLDVVLAKIIDAVSQGRTFLGQAVT